MILLMVATAAALGAAARYAVGVAVTARSPGSGRWGTWIVNVSGAFALGLLVALAADHGVGAVTLAVLGTGFLGAYTTFSTWMVENVELIESRRYSRLAGHLLGSVAAGVLAAWAGLMVGGVR